MTNIGNYQRILNNRYNNNYKTDIHYFRYKEYLNYCKYNAIIPIDINKYLKKNIDNKFHDLFIKKFNKDFNCNHKII